MRIVIDTNRIIASLIKDGISRKIIFNKSFEFFSPDYTLIEINKYKDMIIKKADITNEEFDILLNLIFENIIIISKEGYSDYLEEANKLISDISDVAFIALGIFLKADGIWSDDAHFLEQNKIKIFQTRDMVKLMEFEGD